MAKEQIKTRGQLLKEQGLALKKIKLKEPSAYWRMLELEGKHCLRDI